VRTTGEAITNAGRYYGQRELASATTDAKYRHKALFYLQQLAERAHTLAPYWWRLADSTVSITGGAGNGYGTMPSDFAAFGHQGQVYISGRTEAPLSYMPPDQLFDNRHQSGLGDPTHYSLRGRTSAGLPQIYLWPIPSSSMTLQLYNYVKTVPTLVDCPVDPATAEGIAGNPSGAYTYRVTFVTADGETEGGAASASRTVSSKKIELSSIPLSPVRTVTSRKIYRTAASGVQHKLVATLSDNLTTTYSDNIADGSLGANVPTVSSAVSGMERFPESFHDSVFAEGLIVALMRDRGDARDVTWLTALEAQIKRMWAFEKQGQNAVRALPPHGRGAPIGGGYPSVRSRWAS
jgi:hypothetical protein